MKEFSSTPGSPSFCSTGSKSRLGGITRREAIARTLKAGVGFSVLAHLPGNTGASTGETGRAIAPPDSAPLEMVNVTLNINGTEHTLAIEPRVTLLDALREYLGLSGTKKGCDHGQCGACTVLVNGQRINSCLALAVMHVGDQITTIEGLAEGDKLHPVQAAFIKHDGFQCGYCTPGQICSAVGMLNEGHAKTDDEIREQMAGNICRCGAYQNIVAAVREAMARTT
ncbi:MAG TPA: 2Fe-2S iron-sulfur cluster-binding protein [Lacunisphaera sp.]